MGPKPSGKQSEGVASLDRSVEILSLFAADGVKDLGVTEIASELGLSKAVVHRALTSFKAHDFVEQDPVSQRYRLGIRTLQIGMAYLAGVDAVEMARDILPDLVEKTGETATVSVRSGWRRVYIAQVTPSTDVKMVVSIGSDHPLHAGASSKAILAFMPSEFQQLYLSQSDLARLTDKTLVDKDELIKELSRVHKAGFAVSLGERQAGAGSVAAPVFDYSGKPVASVSVCGPVERFRSEVDHCTKHLMEAVTDLSIRLGHKYSPTQNSA